MAQSGCDATFDPPLSPRIANYEIAARLDTREKKITANERIVWTNPSPDTVRELRFYMYMNAFRNTESTYLRESENLFGRDFRSMTEKEWGFIEVDRMEVDSSLRTEHLRYIQPDDQNDYDRTVMSVSLDRPVPPGGTARIDLDFVVKLPMLISRSGYSRDDFYHVVHWFPQLGVLEENEDGTWKWNCHQFHRRTEFYSNFGTYRVSIEAPDHLTIDGSGCRVSETLPESGWQKVEYYIEDVIDFAWVAYPFFESFYDDWNGVEIRLHTAEEHANLAPRFLQAVKAALAYLEEHVGPYPYPSITMMDPPLHALSAGFMEYPTYITLGSFRYFPKGVRTIESLVIHEFAHQYFMAMVASNEKEEPWLDEGFVTYFEDRIMESTYGTHSSLIDVLGYRISNSDFTRTEYTDLPDPSIAPLSRPGWEYKTSYKGLVYSKSATVLKTMDGLLGRPLMDTVIRTYFNQWKFDHPRGRDFYNVVKDVVGASSQPDALGDIDRFFDQLIYGTGICDYAVDGIENNAVAGKVGLFGEGKDKSFKDGDGDGVVRGKVTVRRMGDVILPVDVRIEFEDGESEWLRWSGEESFKMFTFDKRVSSCYIDPERKVMMDVNMINNSLTLDKNPWPVRKIGAKSMFWLQNLLQSFAFLV